MRIKIKTLILILFFFISTSNFSCLSAKEAEFCEPGDYFWIIYDNVCPYCTSATKYIKQLDWEGRYKFISYRNPQTYKMFPFLNREDCEKDPHLVTPDGKVLKGYEVFRHVIDNLTATKIFNPFLKNDFAEKELNSIYEKMVKERSCYYNKTPTCGGEAASSSPSKH